VAHRANRPQAAGGAPLPTPKFLASWGHGVRAGPSYDCLFSWGTTQAVQLPGAMYWVLHMDADIREATMRGLEVVDMCVAKGGSDMRI